jgi:hypothetical protein
VTTWNYIAERITGDGPGVFLDFELPLTDVTVTDVLSGPPQLTAVIRPAYGRLIADDGHPVLRDDATAIYAEAAGQIRGGWILQPLIAEEEQLRLDGSGFCGYPADQPYDDDQSWVDVDPLDVVRHVWSHLQAHPGGNLGLRVAGTTSPVRIGTPEEAAAAGAGDDPSAGPYRLNWWSTDDLGAVVEELARSTPFDYREQHAWNAARTQVEHFLDLGYPTLGRRRTDLRFVLGENVTIPPVVSLGPRNRANAVRVLGAGEGRDMIHSPITATRDGRIRRVAQVADKSIRSLTEANERARRELAARQGLRDVSTVVVRGVLPQVGDEVRLQAEMDWTDVDQWVRVLSATTRPEEGDAAVLSVTPSAVG